MKKSKQFKEDFAKFLEEPSRESFREYLQNHFGELNECDFKANWPKLPQVARHMLGMANFGGGCVVFGVHQLSDNTFETPGLPNVLDKADIEKGVRKFLPQKLEYEVLQFKYDASEYPKIVGKTFQVLIVESDPKYVPFIAMADSDDIQKDAIYTRRGTNTEKVNYDELQEILDRRIRTGFSSSNERKLNEHLSELRALYDSINRFYPYSAFATLLFNSTIENPNYPNETFDGFVSKMIEIKKEVIKQLLLKQ